MNFVKTTKGAGWGFTGALFAIVALNLLSEQFPLPDNYEDVLNELTHSRIGIFCIAIVSPLVEELIFRLLICGGMLHFHVRPWIAIGVSALCFAIAHWNPAQIPFAFGMGLVLGLLYCRHGLWLPVLVHVTNNSLALVQEHILGDAAKTFVLTDHIGGPIVAWIIIVITGTISIYALKR